MCSFSIYPSKFKNICKNFRKPLKAIFRKLLRCGCFPGNFPQYLRAALPWENYTWWQGSYSESSFTQSFRFITALIFSCVQRNGDYYSRLLCNGLQKLFKIDHLPYSSDRKLCCSPFFLKS